MKVGADIFGMGGSVPTYNFIQPVMHERPVDQMTPRLQIIELILKAVDKYVQDGPISGRTQKLGPFQNML
jgi:hypothetical protein